MNHFEPTKYTDLAGDFLEYGQLRYVLAIKTPIPVGNVTVREITELVGGDVTDHTSNSSRQSTFEFGL